MNPEPTNLACPKHGSAPYLVVVGAEMISKRYCLCCFDDVMTRLGVFGMFPKVAPPAAESELVEWPDSIEEIEK